MSKDYTVKISSYNIDWLTISSNQRTKNKSDTQWKLISFQDQASNNTIYFSLVGQSANNCGKQVFTLCKGVVGSVAAGQGMGRKPGQLKGVYVKLLPMSIINTLWEVLGSYTNKEGALPHKAQRKTTRETQSALNSTKTPFSVYCLSIYTS